MIRRIASLAVLAAAVAAPAQAQTSATFHTTTGTFYAGANGMFTAGASSITGGGFSNGNAFQIWCVDQEHSSSSSNYDVWVSRLDGDLSQTRENSATKYKKAAVLAAGMTSGSQNPDQYAIWAIMHGRSASTQCSSFDGVSGLGQCSSASVQTAMNNAGSNYGNIAGAEWFVITDKKDDVSCNWYSYNCNSYTGKQEFLARCQLSGYTAGSAVPQRDPCDGFDVPNEENPTPEPATMSLIAMGLAGMAGKSLRRRKQIVS